MELFREALGWKVCKGNDYYEGKQRCKALPNNQTCIRDTFSFLVEIPYSFIKAILLQKVVLCNH